MNSFNEMLKNEGYTMITPTVAIGNYVSSYIPFDVIVNLNFPFNNAEPKLVTVERDSEHDKTLFNVGLLDHPEEEMDRLLHHIIPPLLKIYKKNPQAKFLFHCFAGISRSSTVAIAFLCSTNNTPLHDTIRYVKSKRSIVCPNDGFVKCLHIYFNQNKNNEENISNIIRFLKSESL